ncbi:RagB/SusD family nutrient uptake outer membrane protein [Flavobacterium faecale]|uniref:RagB/SusD family nutrient uptake outer membrane protein n=1 Tax=Flavobacterium faecale TaxID=1355330 RepID=UPI003AAFD592
MKIYKSIVFAAAFATLSIVYSCDDVLDVQPESFVADFNRTPAELDASLLGVYDAMQSAYNEANFVFGEYRTDSYDIAGNNVVRASIQNSTMTENISELSWRDFYRVIDRANRIIISGEKLPGADKNTIAQAYAIRSKVYFDLIRIWGNVPLLLEPIKTASDAYKPLSSFDKIMNEVVIPDMLTAEKSISATPSSFNFSLTSVLAHQAEVYMWQKREDLAIPILLKIKANAAYRLANSPSEWQDMFLNQPVNPLYPNGQKIQKGPELIFSIGYQDADPTASRHFIAWTGGAKIMVIRRAVEDKWIERFPNDAAAWDAKYPGVTPAIAADPTNATNPRYFYGDWRLFSTRETGLFQSSIGTFLNNRAVPTNTTALGLGTAAIGDARLHKWNKERSGFVNNLDRTDVVMYRLADMNLLLAEAYIKTDQPTLALNLINELRTARKLPAVIVAEFGTTKDQQINYLLDERQFELMGEGKRWWDLVRNNKVLEIMNPILQQRGVREITQGRIVWPISNNHILESLGQYEQIPAWK